MCAYMCEYIYFAGLYKCLCLTIVRLNSLFQKAAFEIWRLQQFSASHFYCIQRSKNKI